MVRNPSFQMRLDPFLLLALAKPFKNDWLYRKVALEGLWGKWHTLGPLQEEKEMTKGEMVGWHHQLSGHEFEQTPENSEGQRNLACCSPWSHRVGHD